MLEANNFIEDIIVNDLRSGKWKEIITRFPPEPNGYLHIGHAKSLSINFGIKEKFCGKCNLRFDDTNPLKEEDEYVQSIMEDIKWLGHEWDGLYYASDYFDKMYECALELIKKGLAYVCDLSAEETRQQRGTLWQAGINSPYRNRSVEENLALFTAMKEGAYPDGARVLRAKVDMTSPNMNMRDPVMYRILHSSHHRTGDKWCIYPMYDYAHPLSDAIEGITHSICTLEFEDHRPIYDWFLAHLDFPAPPQQIEFARLNIKNTIMSKRFLKRLVDNGAVEGWDDPRMPTLSGLRKRGFPKDAINAFCAAVGVAKADSEIEEAMLEHFVRENLNKNALRAMAVEDPIKVVITNWQEGAVEQLQLANHPQYSELGSRSANFSGKLYIEREDFALAPPKGYKRLTPQGTVRLWGAYIIKHTDSKFDKDGKIDTIYCEYLPESKSGSSNATIKVKGVIHWVDASNCVPIEFYNYQSLLIDETEELKDFADRLNPNSLFITKGFGEGSLAGSANGDCFQFMRKAYYKRESSQNALRFNRIVELKDSYKPKG